MSGESRVIAVGDIHGCATALATMLATLNLRPTDTLVVLGDVVDRGPDTKGVLDQLLQAADRCQFAGITGNHEQMLFDSLDGRMALQDWLRFGGAETLDSYGPGAALNAVSTAHLDFLRSWGDYYETRSHFFAHANYQESLPLAEQPWDTLRWVNLDSRTPRGHRSGKTAIVGHSSHKQGQIVNLGHLVCIDTFCHGGGWLTALDVQTGQTWQTNQRGKLELSYLPPAKSTAAIR